MKKKVCKVCFFSHIIKFKFIMSSYPLKFQSWRSWLLIYLHTQFWYIFWYESFQFQNKILLVSILEKKFNLLLERIIIQSTLHIKSLLCITILCLLASCHNIPPSVTAETSPYCRRYSSAAYEITAGIVRNRKANFRCTPKQQSTSMGGGVHFSYGNRST